MESRKSTEANCPLDKWCKRTSCNSCNTLQLTKNYSHLRFPSALLILAKCSLFLFFRGFKQATSDSRARERVWEREASITIIGSWLCLWHEKSIICKARDERKRMLSVFHSANVNQFSAHQQKGDLWMNFIECLFLTILNVSRIFATKFDHFRIWCRVAHITEEPTTVRVLGSL